MEKSNMSHNRRAFLKSSLLAGGGFMISFSGLAKLDLENKLHTADIPTDWYELTGYIKITPDNVIKIFNPNPEFGQNVMTSLPMIVAEELDVEWKKVIVELGPHDNVKLGPQFSGGSNSIRMYWKPLREAGAAARTMLLTAAAQTWNVPVDELTTKAGTIYHQRTNQSGTYGEFASKAVNIPIPKEIKLKDVKDFTVIRNSQKNVEGQKIVTGKALFGLDYTQEGTLIAMIEHPPAFGLKVKSFDASETLKMPGIKDVFTLKLYEDGYELAGFDTRTFNDLLVVVGNTTWEVMNARKKLKVEWQPKGDTIDILGGRNGRREVVVPGALESTDIHLAKMKEYSAKPAQLLRKDGDPEAAFKKSY